MSGSNNAKTTENLTIVALEEWAMSESDNPLMSKLVLECCQARRNGEDHVLSPRYVWEASSDDVVWEFRGAGSNAYCEYRFLANPIARGTVNSLPSYATEESILTAIKVQTILNMADKSAKIIQKIANRDL